MIPFYGADYTDITDKTNEQLLETSYASYKHCSSLKQFFLCFFAVKPTVIHTDMFVNSIGPVNAINMVSNVGTVSTCYYKIIP